MSPIEIVFYQLAIKVLKHGLQEYNYGCSIKFFWEDFESPRQQFSTVFHNDMNRNETILKKDYIFLSTKK